MKLKCVRKADDRDPSFTVGNTYEVDVGLSDNDSYIICGDDRCTWAITKDTLEFAGMPEFGIFEIVEEPELTEDEHYAPYFDEPMSPQRTRDAVQVAAIRSIQEQCSKANLSISIDPEGFNIFDCDTDMQTMVHSVADVLEILESKLKFKSDMEQYQWM